jgi:Glyoxalase-like domain
VSGGRAVALETRRERVDAEVSKLVGLGASKVHIISDEGTDHYGVLMNDPEGNEFCVA